MTLHTPLALVEALAEHLPRLQAEESLRLASAVALGSGTLKKDDARDLYDSLRKQARIGRTTRASSANFAALGFDVVGSKS